MQAPKVEKVVLNMGLGREAVINSNVIERALEQLTLISGQKPVITKARKSGDNEWVFKAMKSEV
jgi:large subunit ribosomal protein L5